MVLQTRRRRPGHIRHTRQRVSRVILVTISSGYNRDACLGTWSRCPAETSLADA
jgi:hypothetical protein